jgi:hypothetical protein
MKKYILAMFLLILSCSLIYKQNRSDRIIINDTLIESKIKNHNKDSLTVDTCLCNKRINATFGFLPKDTFDINYYAASKSENGRITWDYKPILKVLSGLSEAFFNDSCKILGVKYGE